MSTGIAAIAAERLRQIKAEGWTTEHDDAHESGAMARAAACYAQEAGGRLVHPPRGWPWEKSWWKPKDRRSDLVRAGALIAAEIERINRAVEKS